jgi:hypothetical protein
MMITAVRLAHIGTGMSYTTNETPKATRKRWPTAIRRKITPASVLSEK